MSAPAPIVLGIESSCDETGVAVVRGTTELVTDTVASSMEEHARYGGIIPEVAARAHLEAFVPTVTATLEKSGLTMDDIDAIACTAGPGLVGSLAIGTSAAKALAYATGKPLYGANHIIGHALVDQLAEGPLPERFIALIVSGGHSVLLEFNGTAVRVVGETLDDAAGEAFDKVGRIMGLPYPAGPHIDKLAQQGNPDAIRFPRGLTRRQDMEKHPYDFSFSGLKTSAARWIEAQQDAGNALPLEDLSASYSEAVSDVFVMKTIKACHDLGIDTVVIGGGFSANTQLRTKIKDKGEAAGLIVRIPPLRYCTDNGAMIAEVGAFAVENGLKPSSLDFAVDSSMPLTRIVA